MNSEIATKQEKVRNLELIRNNPYTGRGIAIGLDDSGKHIIQVYWITGRSENSRNRVMMHDSRGRVFTEPAYPAGIKDPSLIIYNAMGELRKVSSDFFIVSNGAQTDSILKGLIHSDDNGFRFGVCSHEYEPDNPHFTPRISGIVSFPSERAIAVVEMASVRKAEWWLSSEYHFHEYPDLFVRGAGYCLTTYSGDGDPLQAFRGEPFPVPIVGDAEKIAHYFWDALYEPNRVSLAVKSIDVDSRESTVTIINRL